MRKGLELKGSFDLLVLIVGLGLTFWTWKVVDRMVEKQLTTELLKETGQYEGRLKKIIGEYEAKLLGAKGLFAASIEVERGEFSEYFRGADVLGEYPGLYSFSYVSKVADADARKFLTELGRQLEEGGIAGQVRNDLAEAPEHYLLNYISVVREQPSVAYGLDLQKDESRRMALDKARDTGEIAASGPIVVLNANEPGMILTVPVYQNGAPVTTVEERRSALVGWVNAVILYEDLFSKIVEPGERVGVIVRDGGQVLHGEYGAGHNNVMNRGIEVGGREWELEFLATITDGRGLETNLPMVVLAVGVMTSFLLFGLSYALASSQVRAESMALEMTGELAKFKLAVENTSEHVVITDADGQILFANEAAQKVTGYSRAEMRGNTPRLWGKQMSPEFYERMWRQIKEEKKIFEGELKNKRKNGEPYFAWTSISPILDKEGRVEYFVGVERDLTREREVQRRAEMIVDTMGEGLIVIDTRHNVTFINKMAGELLGVEPLDVVGRPWTEVVRAFGSDGLEITGEERSYFKVLNEKQKIITELKDGHYYKSGSGRLFPIISVTTVLEGVGVVKVFRDMTDEVADKEALRQEKDLAKAIVNAMGEGLMVIDHEYRVTLINPVAEQMLGILSKDAVGRKWSDLVKAYEGGNEIPFARRTFTRVVKTSETLVTGLDLDHYYVNKAGKKFPLISVTAPLTIGDRSGAVKVFRDATEEKESRSMLQAQASGVLENAGEGIVLTDDVGRISFVNPAFERMAGVSNSEIVGKVFADSFKFYSVDEKPLSAVAMADAASVTARRRETKVILESWQGKKTAIVINAAPLKVGPVFKGVVRMIHDWSEDLELQKQKDDFFSIASHELRTPLTVIAGNLDTILAGYGRSKISAEDRQLLRDTELAGDRLIAIVNNFLNVSRLDQGRIKMTIKQVDVCQITGDVVNEMKMLTGEKGLKLTYSCKKSQRKAMADENLVKEILINLIGNSLKFTEKGGIRIVQATRGGNTVVTLTDTGIGIAADKQKLLFQRFQQAMQRTLSREAGGTGLGLYISREFARMMGGDLKLVRSGMGRGSCFELTLPAVKKSLALGEKKKV